MVLCRARYPLLRLNDREHRVLRPENWELVLHFAGISSVREEATAHCGTTNTQRGGVIMRILVATDGSVHSETAAKTLVAMGPPAHAQIAVLYVIEALHYYATPLVPPPYYHELHRVERELNREAQEAAGRATDEIARIVSGAGASVETILKTGHPADTIVSTVEETDYDLAVVGSKGLTGSHMFALGSVSQKVAKYAPCSVLMTRPPADPKDETLSKVILATDGSVHSLAAARFLSLFRLSPDCEIVLLHVLPPAPSWAPKSGSSMEALEQLGLAMIRSADEAIDKTKDNLSTDARITTLVGEGDPAQEILRVGAETGADLTVMGYMGLSGVKRFLLGSVSQKVSRYSHGSVLVVKTPGSDPGAGDSLE